MVESLKEKATRLALQNYTICILYANNGNESGYVLSHPELPGCVAEGDTYEEAYEFLKDATYGYILLLLEYDIDVPNVDISSTQSIGQSIFSDQDENANRTSAPFTLKYLINQVDAICSASGRSSEIRFV